MFACNSAGSTYGICSSGTRIYNCKIYDDETGTEIIRDLRPVINLSTNKDGFFDVISQTFYPYLSTTDFIHGPNISSQWKEIII